MNINEFLETSGDYTINHEQAQLLNESLLTSSPDQFSETERSKISGYLATALNMDSVEANSIGQLDLVLKSFQDYESPKNA